MQSASVPDPGRRGPWGVRTFALALVGLVLLFGLVGWIAQQIPRADEASVPLPSTSPPASSALSGSGIVYLALGDSLSRGVQPDDAVNLRNGYPRQLARSLPDLLDGKRVKLIEAGCGGATTESFLQAGKECAPQAPIPYANTDAASSQDAWAQAALKARGDRPTLVTLTIGGNDILPCPTQQRDRLAACLDEVESGLRQRWSQIASGLKAAAGRRTVLVTATSYDPTLAVIAINGPFQDEARRFHEFVVKRYNPLLRKTFERAGWRVADLAKTMREGGSTESRKGTAIKAVCDLTWACNRGDVHLNDQGYSVLAGLLEAQAVEPLRASVTR